MITPHSQGNGWYADLRGLRTHYLDAAGGAPPIVLLHGLSANAAEFGGLISAGLSPRFRVVAPDLRGRGRSAKPESGYGMTDHAGDVLALMDALGLERVVLGGHSFGAYVAIYVATHAPARVAKLIVIDAAVRLNPRVGDLLRPSLERLGRVMPSTDAYLNEVRHAPYLNGLWTPDVEAYFRAEIRENKDGTAVSETSASAVTQAMQGLVTEPWPDLVRRVRQPTLLLNAVGAYGPPGSPALVEEASARETVGLFPNCRYVQVPGNHLTMVFGEGAVAICREIELFVGAGAT